MSISKNNVLKEICPIIENNVLFYPCSVLTTEGQKEISYIVDKQAYFNYTMGLYKDSKYFNHFCQNDIVEIYKSEIRLPFKIAQEIYDFGETRMGGRSFLLIFDDKSEQHYETGSFVDFLEYPLNKSAKRVINVKGGNQSDNKYLKSMEPINIFLIENLQLLMQKQ
ncbi:MAG: hypothetical protein GXX85_13410 [Ignavibacteria bacterium]|nr:hypothetical protein [Ignavibacteria bacterium]